MIDNIIAVRFPAKIFVAKARIIVNLDSKFILLLDDFINRERSRHVVAPPLIVPLSIPTSVDAEVSSNCT